MKLAFSTRYMPPMSLSAYLSLAKEQKFRIGALCAVLADLFAIDTGRNDL